MGVCVVWLWSVCVVVIRVVMLINQLGVHFKVILQWYHHIEFIFKVYLYLLTILIISILFSGSVYTRTNVLFLHLSGCLCIHPRMFESKKKKN